MYKSPIELLITEVTNQIVKEQDEAIFKSALSYVPNVDRAELLRALQYDRDQYEKGYADGKADAMAKVVRCGFCKHWDEIEETEGSGYCHHPCWLLVGHEPPVVHFADFCSYGERKDK